MLSVMLMTMDDQKVMVKGKETIRKSTAGRNIYCEWKDGFTLWEKLSNLKELHQIQVAEYAITQDIEHGPAFYWWVCHVLKKRDRIISLLKMCSAWYLKMTHKFGSELLKIAKKAIVINKKKEIPIDKMP